jgi:hypothetical protein
MSRDIKRDGDCWHGSMSWPPHQTAAPAEMASAAREFMNSRGTEPPQVMHTQKDAPQTIYYNGRKIDVSKKS